MLNDDEWGNSDTVVFAEDYTKLFIKLGVSSSQSKITFKGRIRKKSGRKVLEINTHEKIRVKKLQDGRTDKNKRMLQEGSHTILVIRVTDKDNHAPKETQQELSESIFGGLNDKVGLATQMAACSGGSLVYKPVEDDPATNTKGGVVDLRIPYSVKEYGPYTPNISRDWDRKKLEKDVIKHLVKEFPVYRNWRQFKHTMIMLPAETDFRQDGHVAEPIAYAYIGGRKAVFKDPYGAMVWVQLHEIGHSNGLGHSGTKDGFVENSYGDKTCMMGSHNGNDDAPQLCYNAAKSWNLGWYEDQNGHEELFPYSSWEGNLVAAPDYIEKIKGKGNPGNAYRAVIKIGTFYIQFNRKKHPTIGFLPEDIDKVAVVEQPTQLLGTTSWKVGNSLGAGEKLRAGIHTVKVLSINTQAEIPHARVAVYNSDYHKEPFADSPKTSPPFPNPTQKPAPNPTHHPTPFPTRHPSPRPTHHPTPLPTRRPSPKPTPFPTRIPTPGPTPFPTFTGSDLLIYEVFPNPNKEKDKNAEYIKLFNPSNTKTIFLTDYQVYDATSNRFDMLSAKSKLGPREFFVLCRDKAWFDAAGSKRPSGASGGCDQQGHFVLHDRLSTIILQRQDGPFYDDIDSVQTVDAVVHRDEVYARTSDEPNAKAECATCYRWMSAYK